MTELPRTLFELFLRRASRTPDAPAIRAPSRPPLDYRALAALVVRTTGALRAAGLGRGARVATVLPNGPEAATTFLAATAVGAAAPLNEAYGPSELELYLADLRADGVIVPEHGAPVVREVAARLGVRVFDLVVPPGAPAGAFELRGLAPPGEVAIDGPAPEDIALLLHTSGTTAKPKLVPLTHANLTISAENIRRALQLSPADACLNVMPLFHIHGLVGVLLASLMGGASVICTPGFFAPRFFDWADAESPTWYSAVPTIHQAVLARAEAHADVVRRMKLRLVRSSSAPLAVQVMRELEATFRAPVIESYGMTEAAQQMAISPLPPGVRKAGSPGVANGPEIAIMDEAGERLPARTVGEIVIRGPNVMSGYLGDPEVNARAFTNGWFRTGDLGYLDEDGYLFITGRSKEIINRGGEKISPREIDELLLQHPAVGQAATFAAPSATLGERVATAVVLRPGRTASAEELRDHVAAHLAPFKVPEEIVFLDELPKGHTGKIQRVFLAEKLGLARKVDAAPSRALVTETAGAGATQLARAPTALEARLAKIWEEVLELPDLSPSSDFLDLGGDSVLATAVVARIREELGVELSIHGFFDARTLARVAERVERVGAARGDVAPSPVSPERATSAGGPRLLSFMEERLWILDRLGPGSPAYVVPLVVQIDGPLDVTVLEDSLMRVVERHDALRTTYHAPKGGEGEGVRRSPWAEVGPVPKVRLTPVRVAASDEPTRRELVEARARALVHTPFDLATGPSFRVELLALSPTRHVLVLALHHIVFDGWSAGVIIRDLARAYGSRGAALPPNGLDYSSFAVWHRATFDGARLAPELEHWRRRLAGAPAALELPADHPRPPVQTAAGARRTVVIPAEVAGALGALARREHATSFMVLLAAFEVLLARVTGEDDVVVGTPIAGRRWRETEDVVGVFVNSLVLRGDLRGDPTFRELVARTRAVCLDAYAHQDLPFEQLVEALRPARDLSRSPIFQVGFQERNVPMVEVDAGGAHFAELEVDRRASTMDLVAEVQHGPRGLVTTFEWNTDLFDAGTIHALLGAWVTLLAELARDPDQHVQRVSLVPEADRALLAAWNQTRTSYPREETLHRLFFRTVDLDPRATSAELAGRVITRGELAERARAMAAHLVALGVEPGDRVAILAPPTIEALVAILGILEAGAAYLPLDPLTPGAERTAWMFEAAEVDVALVAPELAAELPTRVKKVISLDAEQVRALPAATGPLGVERCADDVALVVFTSGSTGRPKGVLIPHRALVRAASFAELPIGAEDRVAWSMNLAFDAAHLELWTALVRGACLVGIERDAVLAPKVLARTLKERRVSALFTTTVIFHQVAREVPGAFSQMRSVVFGGEVVDPVAVRAVLEAGAPARLFNAYGPTECGVITTAEELAHAAPAALESGEAVPIGRPMSNTKVYVVDRRGGLAPIGVPGELAVGGDAVALGYLGGEPAAEARFSADPWSEGDGARLYRTGDRARWRRDGKLEFLGRFDHQVKIRGMRVEPEEIAAVAGEHPAVREAVVILRADTTERARPESHRAQLVLYVVPRAEPIDVETLRDHLARKLPDYMVPRAIVVLDHLPIGPLGKIDRRALPEPDASALPSPAAGPAPSTPAESRIAAIWGELLGEVPASTEVDFFTSGGHSLLATSLASRLEDAFGVSLSVRTVFERPTIAGLALEVTKRQAEDVDPSALAAFLADLDG